ncbi:DNA primase [Lacisediminimonas sp.]|uniref:DNA primase n=1 Tax=Lacisediminimonas sp. TaxID=3060582 RepID=UPI0027241902|nr:DNA primase [Lacisediminimonas sp.]MDO8298557.1 DNA primase [Lacisediminimonas sp.]MDO9217503.1 DNA primase [Lacisediminimonas sp.]
MIPPNFIQDLLNRVDIVDVVGRYVQLKKGGANFMGLCPFHNEKSPSFTVSPTKQFYHCFGCGAHGTAIGFLIEYSGAGFIDAVKQLADGVGMVVPERDDKIPPAARAEAQAKSMALSEALNRACDYYRHQLRATPQAIDYLKGRGLSGEIAARFGIGFAPERWDGLREACPSYEDEALVESGLVILREPEGGAPAKRYDRFRNRIMFPIRNVKGQVIGFGGRVMDGGEPKYLNSPETPLFQKGAELYGLFEARQAIREAGYVLVTEGYMDVVALAQLGFPQAVATLGTACTATHVQKLVRQTDHVIFSFDGDGAGRRAARRALEASLPHAADNRTIGFLFLPPEHDPDSYVREFGADVFAGQVKNAMPLSQFLLNEVGTDCDLNTAEGRARMQHEAKPLLQAMPASALRMQIIRSLAKMTQSSPDEIESFCGLSKRAVRMTARPTGRAARTPPVELERQVMRLLVAQPALATELDDDALQVVGHFAPDSGAMLFELAGHCRAIGADAGFAALSEQLRMAGSDFDNLIAEVAGDSEAETDPEVARMELRGALRQSRLRLLKSELEQLVAGGLPGDADRERYRELTRQQEALKRQSESEAAAR